MSCRNTKVTTTDEDYAYINSNATDGPPVTQFYHLFHFIFVLATTMPSKQQN